jgi:HD-GYP domain-containing protein (c-di-GMP phosphodiesterase class II)
MRLTEVSPDLEGARLARPVHAGRGELLLGRGERLTRALLLQLERRGVRHVYVDDDFLPALAPDPDLDEATRALVGRSLRRVMDGAAQGEGPDMGEIAAAATRLVAAVDARPGSLFSLSRLRAADEATAQHGINVAVFALLAADHYRLTEGERTVLAVGALLHDVGKAFVPLGILRKPGPLTADEWAVMRRHPEMGHRFLVERAGVDARVAAVALGHHERLDGGGYPHGLSGAEVDRFARLAAVADVWDAMASTRWYKPSFPHAYVAAHMRASPGLDREAVEALLARVALFPTGSFVRLTNGSLAWVVGQDPRRPTHPRLLVLTDGRGEPVTPYVAELAGAAARVEATLPALPFAVRENARRHMDRIARLLEDVPVDVPPGEAERRPARGGAAPSPAPPAPRPAPPGA